MGADKMQVWKLVIVLPLKTPILEVSDQELSHLFHWDYIIKKKGPVW